ncbi:hypothetical protein E2K98_19965 [Bacillus salipaludis]|uniref:Uncharacterized protein n=1 Tax=Bacillus salipaludis TaxID=2547811 RepID=A0A4R5VNC6_9BACI|nr:hypothetical protein [Bacillus salipaludis]TDK59498.1 hypothetical protein E2K98_19965 [Bacillus salipaludis]
MIAFCGQHNAIWFSILFDEVKENFNLNYEWNLCDTHLCDPIFAAKAKDGRWDLEKVLEDTLKIAEYF